MRSPSVPPRRRVHRWLELGADHEHVGLFGVDELAEQAAECAAEARDTLGMDPERTREADEVRAVGAMFRTVDQTAGGSP